HRINARDSIYQTAYEHFVQEAFALSKLTHPNTLRIYDFGYLAGEAEGEYGPPFQVSEFMNGGTLARRISRNGPMDPADVRRIVGPLCHALAEAHACGIVHRDIKPQNILFGTAGPNRVAKLADFGIAKSLPVDEHGLGHRAGDTRVVSGRELLMYSASWAAPEQLIGSPVTTAVDIYSFGLTVLYTLTGSRLLRSRSRDEGYVARTGVESAIDDVLEAIRAPAVVADVFKRACAFAACDRYPTVAELGCALDEALGHAELVTMPERIQIVPDGEPGGTHLESGVTIPESGVTIPEPVTAPVLPTRRVRPTAAPTVVGGRKARFVEMTAGRAEVRVGPARLRVSAMPLADGMSVHVKGQTCFVATADRRPSSAVNLRTDHIVELVAPNRQVIARGAVRFGTPRAGYARVTLGDETIMVAATDCSFLVALDFGPGAECLLLYTSAVSARRASAGARPRRSMS
ncbi:MAG: serine/threonine protein kinase, partial [Pseudomonadales bacterium]|nr:serine/threonine protein kinase [Pseudomonadales bacterium]